MQSQQCDIGTRVQEQWIRDALGRLNVHKPSYWWVAFTHYTSVISISIFIHVFAHYSPALNHYTFWMTWLIMGALYVYVNQYALMCVHKASQVKPQELYFLKGAVLYFETGLKANMHNGGLHFYLILCMVITNEFIVFDKVLSCP